MYYVIIIINKKLTHELIWGTRSMLTLVTTLEGDSEAVQRWLAYVWAWKLK